MCLTPTSAAITPLAEVDHLSFMVPAGKYRNGASPKGARMEFFKGYMARYRAERPTAALEEYCKIAQKYESEYASAHCCSRLQRLAFGSAHCECSHAVCRVPAVFLFLVPHCTLLAAVTPSELALAWCKSRWFVTSTIIGGECNGIVPTF